jgi:AcrR family transcriptional regulator
LNISNICFRIKKEGHMESDEHSVSGTRDRILEAAGELFAESGFQRATVRKICERAGVNVSAIKYHYGGKEELYSEVLRYWHEFAIKKYPPLLGIGENGSPEEQMRAFIRSLLFRLLDKGKPAWFGKLMAREMAEPTGIFDRLVEENVRPLHELLASIIRKIIGSSVSTEIIRLCCLSIVGQCLSYYNERVVTQLFQRDMATPEEIERIADHILRFSLKGLKYYVGGRKEVHRTQKRWGRKVIRKG